MRYPNGGGDATWEGTKADSIRQREGASQNGIAERFNRTILELVRAMLIARDLPQFLWAEAAAHAVYLRNRAPSKALDGMTPEEAWTGKKPDVSHLARKR